MSRILLICAILCATVFCVTLAGVPLENFYRFGKNHGDKRTDPTVNPDRIDLEPPFRIFGKERNYVYVYRNGWIELAGGYIMPFRQSNEEVDLDKARREIGSAFPAFQDIDLKWVVIGTWKQTGNTQHPNDLNTFQAILTTDGVRSFVIYNYNETKRIEKETWAGFTLTHATDVYSYTIEGSSTDYMLTIDRADKANVVWAIDYESISSFEEPYVTCITDLWQDQGVQKAYERMKEYQIIDSAKYYLSNVKRLALPNYLPTEQDILRVRMLTTLISELSFKVDKFLVRTVDVGGQRSLIRKWIHLFEDVTSIIFMVALSEYDQKHIEFDNKNKEAFQGILSQYGETTT
ncbi:g-protein alpha subunit domain-containing protein [Ditylenchus destructor]|nr:g-protein alpha subunit domain-containing protein [Ditylenchus destructor]